MTTALPKSGGTYTFASQPRAVAPQRSSKYREPVAEGAPLTYGNMMYDPRIVRGNTYRLQTVSQSKQPDPLELQMQQEKLRRTLAKKRAEEKLRVRTPDAVAGRQHSEVQTELYLEELADRVDETEAETQTDAFLDRPPSPLFIAVKSGVDAATQIENGELFDFDVEVRPILEVLVGKTVEQALMEVMEEEELARLRNHQREFEELRNAELVETQRREDAARRAREEKDRRVRQARDALVKEKETSEKVAARAFAKNYVANLVPSVFTALSTSGYFYDEQEREIENQFIPWLLDNVDARLVEYCRARDLLDAIIEGVVQKRLEAFAALEPQAPRAKEPVAKPAAAAPAAAAAAAAPSLGVVQSSEAVAVSGPADEASKDPSAPVTEGAIPAAAADTGAQPTAAEADGSSSAKPAAGEESGSAEAVSSTAGEPPAADTKADEGATDAVPAVVVTGGEGGGAAEQVVPPVDESAAGASEVATEVSAAPAAAEAPAESAQ